jgi:hypothetical protein
MPSHSASASERARAGTFQLWVFSDAHVATDKAASLAIRNGIAVVTPASYPETLAACG